MDTRRTAYFLDLLRQIRPSDARGVARLATGSTLQITKITEGVHQAVWARLGFPNTESPQATRGMTRFVYKAVYGITSLVGKGLDGAFATAEALLDPWTRTQADSPQREALIAALNGVMGDQLQLDSSPLTVPLSLRFDQQSLDLYHRSVKLSSALNQKRKLVVLIHGLCMNDFQRYAEQREHALEHGAVLSETLGYTPIYLRYNTGLHISANGEKLSCALEQLVSSYPDLVDEMAVVAHSMGGLLIRSAVNHAQENQLYWPKKLRHIIFLGTPHQGAPLEVAGNWLDAILGSTSFTQPFKRLGQLRSAGITDLRYGNVRDDDWQEQNRHELTTDQRHHTALPESIMCYAIAASKSDCPQGSAKQYSGDGLVSVASALGIHKDPSRSLNFHSDKQWIALQTGHMGLLNSPAVSHKIIEWLTRDGV